MKSQRRETAKIHLVVAEDLRHFFGRAPSKEVEISPRDRFGRDILPATEP
jgi:hypothetical protein